MQARDLLPWNWHQQSAPARKDAKRGEAARFSASLLDELLADFQARPFGGRPSGVDEGFLPALDVEDEEDRISVRCELPGLDEKDIEVSLEGDLLRIRGDKRSEREEEGEHGHWRECSYGSFERAIPVPCAIEEEAVEASFRKGVLTVTLPKTEEARQPTRRIEVQQ